MRDGWAYGQIAERIGITKRTLYDWRIKYPAIGEAMQQGREHADMNNKLLKRALGYTSTESRVEVYSDEAGSVTGRKTVTITKEITPDTNAAIFWLKNRAPAHWRGDQYIIRESLEPAKFGEYIQYMTEWTKATKELGYEVAEGFSELIENKATGQESDGA